jgi:hypothetical protein
MFMPGQGPIELVRTETWDDFTAQTQALSNSGYVLSAMTTIQNLNRTWFYGAYQRGSGNFQLFRTSDSNAFQQMFALQRLRRHWISTVIRPSKRWTTFTSTWTISWSSFPLRWESPA